MSSSLINFTIDFESGVQHRRQPLPSIDETTISSDHHHHSTNVDVIYLKREDSSNSIFSIESKLCLQGDLSWLISIFERFTSNIIIQDDEFETRSTKTSFSKTFQEDEDIDDHDLPESHSIVCPTSVSSQSSSSPPLITTSPTLHRRHFLNKHRSPTTHSTASDSSFENFNKNNFASILLPNMKIHQVFDALLCNGLKIIKVFSHFDSQKILHQDFIFTRTYSSIFKPSHHLLHRSTSNKGP